VYKYKDGFNNNKKFSNSIVSVGDVADPIEFFLTVKLSAVLEFQAWFSKFAKPGRFLIGFLSQELINVIMWLDVSCLVSHLLPTFTDVCWSNIGSAMATGDLSKGVIAATWIS
jgi:hypothetical protein